MCLLRLAFLCCDLRVSLLQFLKSLKSITSETVAPRRIKTDSVTPNLMYKVFTFFLLNPCSSTLNSVRQDSKNVSSSSTILVLCRNPKTALSSFYLYYHPVPYPHVIILIKLMRFSSSRRSGLLNTGLIISRNC